MGGGVECGKGIEVVHLLFKCKKYSILTSELTKIELLLIHIIHYIIDTYNRK